MSKTVHKEWVVDESSEPDDIGYWFSRNYGSCACVSLRNDGTLVFDGFARKVIIKNIGTANEQVVVEKAVDLVV